ncbi:hypothetical protein BX616_006643 [Lobosporangium transversale]|uniref:F-box domain-containing protein n=1 Tax=Lobosporangium transversale TaxID=64571 RepID=A0A1Y2G8Q2_9FUNG|nr:hypothetical protein BCR41DRAFT_401067 [Lobosporangium transversale]KAF9915215.1 hypothetical protein BX616_006643 [Lobosporangium transversale]ORZ04394.1 hypothetical protein BCR41DRAFT_401067 [Lobosporangium transversale]|eukprot:XP_021876502.1 hypothetical protein BCR41DRAFT_401067 [Lobosporangium transversale]
MLDILPPPLFNPTTGPPPTFSPPTSLIHSETDQKQYNHHRQYHQHPPYSQRYYSFKPSRQTPFSSCTYPSTHFPVSSSLPPSAIPNSPIFPSDNLVSPTVVSSMSYNYQANKQGQGQEQRQQQQQLNNFYETASTTLTKMTPDANQGRNLDTINKNDNNEDYLTTAVLPPIDPMLNHFSQSCHTRHRLNQSSFHQLQLSAPSGPYFAPVSIRMYKNMVGSSNKSSNSNSSTINDSDNDGNHDVHGGFSCSSRIQLATPTFQQRQQHYAQITHEYQATLVSPPEFTRSRDLSMNSIHSIKISNSVATVPDKGKEGIALATAICEHECSINNLTLPATETSLTAHLNTQQQYEQQQQKTNILNVDFEIQSPSTHINKKEATASTPYEALLKQIAVQRAKLNVLQTGVQTLSRDLVALNEVLEEEQDSKDGIIRDAQTAVQGWQESLEGLSKCEPIEILQKRPNVVATLIQSMNWCDKKHLFEQLVAGCLPRETYQLQHQILSQYGNITGFDMLEGLPLSVSKMVMMNLSFVDLANCRMVSQSWKYRATAYDVVATALGKLTYSDDTVAIDPKEDGPLKNWNQLCRYHERDVRWKKGQPVSMFTMQGHTNFVTSIKDLGGWIVSGGYDEKVRLWEASSGRCVKTWNVDSAVSCVELFLDANMEGSGVVVAAFVDTGLVKLWPLHGPSNPTTLMGHQKGVRATAINETYLVTAGFDRTVLVWNWSTRQRVACFRAHNDMILSIHLSKRTVYTLCIDATLRVFDIPSKTLLHQVKLFEVQHGSSLQWSCLHNRMLLTVTNKKVYVWQLEHLESLVKQQNLRRPCRSSSVVSTASFDNSVSQGEQSSVYLDVGSQYPAPPRVIPASLNSKRTVPPETPSGPLYVGSRSSYFHSTPTSSSPISPSLSELSTHRVGLGPCEADLETRVKPYLTAILSMTMDMWCGKVTHHDPPLLVMGSRNSSIKLTLLPLTRSIIDPSRVYEASYPPLMLSPTSIPIQGMPAGHGLGVMCIDSDASRLVVGCTGGSIQLFNMDPAMMAVIATRTKPNSSITEPESVIALPQLRSNKTASIRSASSTHSLHSTAPGSSATVTAEIIPTSAVAGKIIDKATRSVFSPTSEVAFITTQSKNIGRSRSRSSPSLLVSEQPPQRISYPNILTLPHRSNPRNMSSRQALGNTAKQQLQKQHQEQQKSLPLCSEYEKQEILVDSADETILHRIRYDEISFSPPLSSLALLTPEPSRSSSPDPSFKLATVEEPIKAKKKSNIVKKVSSVVLLSRTDSSSSVTRLRPSKAVGGSSASTSAKALSSGYSTPLSSLSKYISNQPAKMMITRRRATSSTGMDQMASYGSSASMPSSNSTTPLAAIIKGRNRSDSNLLSSVRDSVSSSNSSSSSVPTLKDFSKRWSFTPWNSSSRRTSKSKGVCLG